jgi:hypothetical protein
LRKKPRLHLLGNRQLLRGAPFSFEPGGEFAAALLDRPRHIVESR